MDKSIAVFVAAIFTVVVLTTFTPSKPSSSSKVADVEFVAWVTGPQSPNWGTNHYDVDGTDLGSIFEMNNRLYMAFGDTYSCCRPLFSGGAGGGNWRSNVLAYTTDRDLDDGITFDNMISDQDRDARAVLQKMPGDYTVIPTYGISINDRMYLHYMAVREWDSPGKWTLNRSGWAYSDDQGETWTQPENATWNGDTNFAQTAIVRRDGYLYLFGIHAGRFGSAALARVPEEQVLNMGIYQYWDGSTWSKNLKDAAAVASGPIGELSVAWSPYLDRWIMTYLDENQHAIVIRDAPELTGPWNRPQVLVSDAEYPSLYGAFLYPITGTSDTIYFNMSQWGPYNVRLMRAHLSKLAEQRT
jgi:hypothetical protein